LFAEPNLRKNSALTKLKGIFPYLVNLPANFASSRTYMYVPGAKMKGADMGKPYLAAQNPIYEKIPASC
jgi:hypothetical protein